MNDPAELHILARRVLLDALDALGPHRDALVLVGAQAVYLRVGDADLAVDPFTTDGDLVVDPAVLGELPPLEQALLGAGFSPKTNDSVGVWVTERSTSGGASAQVAVDLLVPASVSPGTGRRAARLRGHDSRVARIVQGLDGALVDADAMGIAALEAVDPRCFDLRVAGPAALLVAKVHKIADRQGTSRQSDKDALDVLRLLRGVETGTWQFVTHGCSPTHGRRRRRGRLANCSPRSSVRGAVSAWRWPSDRPRCSSMRTRSRHPARRLPETCSPRSRSERPHENGQGP